MKQRPDKRKERTIFFFTLVFLAMVGVLFDPGINKGVFEEKVDIIKSSKDNGILGEEFFSPKPLGNQISWITMISSVIIILIALFAFEGKLNLKGFNKFLKKFDSIFIKFFLRIQKKIDSIKGVDVKKGLNKISKAKPHKKIKNHYYVNIHPKIHKELKGTKELFGDNYKKEYTDQFIALLFIVAVVGMSLFSMMPSFNHGLIADKNIVEIEQLPPLLDVSLSSEMFSPESYFEGWVFLLAICIMVVASVISLKKETYLRK
jgi:hypothetical protein